MTAVRQTRSDAAALKKVPMLIGGKWVESASGEVLEVEDPAHRRPIAEIPRGRVEDVARAVNAAAEAFPAWSRLCLGRDGCNSSVRAASLAHCLSPCLLSLDDEA